MAKNGHAKVLSNDEIAAVLDEIEHHRYPAKNALIIQTNERTSVRFTVAEFDRLIKQIAKDARRRKTLTASDYYPNIKKSGGQTRELPLADSAYWSRFRGIWMSVWRSRSP